MEGLVPTNRVDQFKDQLKERCVYTIDRFDLYDPRKSYRSVDNPLRIAFTMRTILTEVIPPPENFPMFAYTALPFSMLSDRVDENIVLSGLLAFKSKSVTRWYVNAQIPEIADVRERYRFIARAADTASIDSEDAKFADLYLFGPRGEIVVGKEALTLLSSLRGEANAIPQDLLAIIGKEFSTVVTPRRESLDLLHPHQIAEPILRTNVAVWQGLNDSPAGQVCKDLHTTEATEQVEVTARESTPLSSTNLAPQHLPSPSSTTDEVPPGSPARGKHRATSADKNPKAKKELRFSKDA
ncbi:hypothetical protein ACQ4PT_028803 [Festuca glaucescens]